MDKVIHYFDYIVEIPAGYDEESELPVYETRQGVVAGTSYHEALFQIEEFYGIENEPDACAGITMTYHSVHVREITPCGCECECECDN